MSSTIDLFKTRISNPENQKGLREAVEKYSPNSVNNFDKAIIKVNDTSTPINNEELRKIAAMLIQIKMDLSKLEDDPQKKKHYAFSDILDKHLFAPGFGQPFILEDKLCPPDFYERCKKREEGVVFEGNDGNKRAILGGKKHKTRKHKKKGKKKTIRKKGKKKTNKKKGKKKMKKRGKKKTKKRGKKSRK
jgi:hypothetical protein